jgi:hypothetical protein
MALSVATNTSAATAHRYLKTNDMEASRSLAKLASGSRIVRASDDAASLAVGTKLKADVNALRQAQVNASHGSSVLQVADGALQQVSYPDPHEGFGDPGGHRLDQRHRARLPQQRVHPVEEPAGRHLDTDQVQRHAFA